MITLKVGSLPDVVEFGVIDQLKPLELNIHHDLKTSDCECFKLQIHQGLYSYSSFHLQGNIQM